MIINQTVAGGMKITGIIEEYTVMAGKNVSAGDFVQYVNGIGERVVLDPDKSWSGKWVTACYYDETHVFVVYCGNNTNGFYCQMISIKDKKVTPGTILQVDSTAYSYFSAAKLCDGKIFVANCQGYCSSSTTGTGYLYGIVISVDSSYKLTAGTNKQLSTSYASGYYPKVVVLDSSRVFIAYGYQYTYYYLYGMVVSISGTSITVQKNKQLSTSTYTAPGMDAVLLSSNKILLIHKSGSSSYKLMSMIVTVSQYTMTVASTKQLSTTNNSGHYSSCLVLDSSHVFVSCGYGSYAQLMGMVISVSGNTVTAGQEVILSDEYYSARVSQAVLIDSSHVFLMCSPRSTSSYQKMCGLLLTVSTSAITVDKTYDLSDMLTNPSSDSNTADIMKLSSNSAVIVFGYGQISGYVSAIALDPANPESGLAPYTSKITGVAKTAGSGGSTVSVFVPGVTS